MAGSRDTSPGLPLGLPPDLGGGLAGAITEARSLGDADAIRGHLIAAAREGRSLTYAELLGLLGHRFTRPRMRQLCVTLTAIDRAAQRTGEPALAVLVVRQSDGLPGQGWWIDNPAAAGWDGEWEGPAAAGFVREQQGLAFDWWRGR